MIGFTVLKLAWKGDVENRIKNCEIKSQSKPLIYNHILKNMATPTGFEPVLPP